MVSCLFQKQGEAKAHYIWRPIDPYEEPNNLSCKEYFKSLVDKDGEFETLKSVKKNFEEYGLAPKTRIVYFIGVDKEVTTDILNSTPKYIFGYLLNVNNNVIQFKNTTITAPYIVDDVAPTATTKETNKVGLKKKKEKIPEKIGREIWKLSESETMAVKSELGASASDSASDIYVATVNPQCFQFFIRQNIDDGLASYYLLCELLDLPRDATKTTATWQELYNQVIAKYKVVIDFLKPIVVENLDALDLDADEYIEVEN